MLKRHPPFRVSVITFAALLFGICDLHDVSSEFLPFYDNQIAALRQQLSPSDLQEFKNSGSRLSVTAPFAADQLHRQRQSKIKILEIVWSYLYSGREPQAWSVLSDLWPAADIPRIRAVLTDARAHGLLTQVAGASAAPARKKKHATVFDAETQSSSEKTEVTPPVPILLRRPPPPEIANETSELLLELTIDSAGKVRSAEPAGRAKSMDPALLQATAGWKFIPALNAGRPVASRTRLAVSLRQ